MKYYILIAMAVLLLTNSCAEKKEPAHEQSNENAVVFEGRQIDLQPYFEGFPYKDFNVSLESGKIYYFREGTTRLFQETTLENGSLEAGKTLSGLDFSKRNTWSIKFNKNDKHLYWLGDEKNDEVMNIYKMNPENGKLDKLTDVPYIFGYGLDKQQKRIAYIVRLGTKDERLAELRIMNLETGEVKNIIQDTPELRFIWGTPVFSPDGKKIIAPVLKGTDRNMGNMVEIDIESGTWKLLTDNSIPRRYPNAHGNWLSDTEFFYNSNEDGYMNVYKYGLASGKSEKITDFDNDCDFDVLEIGDKKYILAVAATPVDNTIHLVDPATKEVVLSKTLPLNLSILDSDGDKFIASATSASVMFRIIEFTASTDGFAEKTLIDVPDELKQKIYHAEVEKIEYPTFDSVNGEPRMLHAFLYKPKNPLPKDRQIVMIQSFYGGTNLFNVRQQILAEAGIYVLSPSPRGSSGFGREFYSLNDGDLGGNEIIDVIYAGKYISNKLGIPSERIGVFGGSHGGYASMRLLSFPGEINGNKASFDWGFGMSHAGFSDIIHFYETCNIPDWVLVEAGDPETEADKLRSRSPLYNARDFRGKLLLTHGTNDSRVPIEGSRWMADSLEVYGKDYKLVEFEGQGHGIKGLENNIRFYKTWFDFLETVYE